MPKKLYTSVPPRYEVCLHADCPKADVCLHQIAYQKLLSEQTFLHIINPKMCKLLILRCARRTLAAHSIATVLP